MSTNKGMDKVVVYIYSWILLSHKKKNGIMPFAETWMDDVDRDCHTEWTKSDRERQVL